jgi:hypothetical protein
MVERAKRQSRLYRRIWIRGAEVRTATSADERAQKQREADAAKIAYERAGGVLAFSYQEYTANRSNGWRGRA